jgi:SAM-dependent methyltransferase
VSPQRRTARALDILKSGGMAALAASTRNFAAERYARWRDGSIDRKYGIDTQGIDDDLAALGATGDSLRDAYGYEPVQVPVFRAIVSAAGLDPRHYVMVDFGSGKGRALVLAAESGFRHVIGVELAPQLHRIACRNIEAFRRRFAFAPRIDLHCGDAVALPIPEGEAMLFFFNPFGEAVLRKVAANIQRSYRLRPRSMIIAYRNPQHRQVFEEIPELRCTSANRTFAIYRAS